MLMVVRRLMPFLVLAVAGCRLATNYLAPDGPRYAGAPVPAPDTAGGTLRIVSFNVEYGRQVDSAIAVLAADSAARGADIVFLQEMDARGTERIARAMGMQWVYYPATRRRATGRDFGNAVLSRFPVVADRKILLPHRGRFGRTVRTATAVTLDVAGRPLRVYSLHLGTFVETGPGARRDQLNAVLADASRYPAAIIAGDMNSHGIGRLAVDSGFAWPTQHGPRTAALGRWDHIFLKGLTLADSTQTGTIREVRGASDHRAVWAVARLPRRPDEAAARP